MGPAGNSCFFFQDSCCIEHICGGNGENGGNDGNDRKWIHVFFDFVDLILLQLQQLLLLLGQRNLDRLIATAEHGPEIY